MSGAHTPGPWSPVGDGRYLRAANGDYVCDIKLDETDPNVIANARLIASAPELLEALEYVITAHGEQLHDAFDMAQRAIAKARGAA